MECFECKKDGNMFDNSQFNVDISGWDVGNVNTSQSMFQSSQFNGDISKWMFQI